MKILMKVMLPVLFILGSSCYAGEITKEQCEEYKMYKTLHLTDANKKKVEDSCRKRYASERALGNCTAFEGEDYIKELKKKAETECK